jgi:hypothetical protein
MAMVCPQCNEGFEQRWHCPSCGVRLLYQTGQASTPTRGADARDSWQQTPWGRILVGLLVAQGLYYGLRHLCTAGLLVSGEDAGRDVWNTLYGLIFLQGLQGFCLILGGLLTGAGRQRGAFFGAVVGVWNGVISILVASSTATPLTTVALYGQPILHTAFGALGGLIGCMIWKPLPSVLLRGDSRPAPIISPTPKKLTYLLSGPVSWWRIIAGSAVATGGSLWAKLILEMVLEKSEGKLTIDSHLQAQLVTWEICSLALLAGGAFAGATMSNGLKQGLFVGLSVAAVTAGIRLGTDVFQLEPVLLSASAAVSLGLVGGWFGGALFPALPARAKASTLGPASY